MENPNETPPPPIDAVPDVSQPPGTLQAVIDPRRLIRWVILIMSSCYVLVLLLDYHLNYANLDGVRAVKRLVNMTREDAVGSWLAVIQTALVTVTLWFIYALARVRGASAWTRRGWLVLALFFTYLTFDDGNRFHERMGSTFRAVQSQGAEGGLGSRLLELFPSYSWQLVFLPFFATMGLFLLYFCWRELRHRKAKVLVLIALCCWAGAVGLDFIEGLDEDHKWNLYTWITYRVEMADFTKSRFNNDPFETLRHFSKAIEEVIEMTGNTILWVVFLQYLAETTGTIRIAFHERRPKT